MHGGNQRQCHDDANAHKLDDQAVAPPSAIGLVLHQLAAELLEAFNLDRPGRARCSDVLGVDDGVGGRIAGAQGSHGALHRIGVRLRSLTDRLAQRFVHALDGRCVLERVQLSQRFLDARLGAVERVGRQGHTGILAQHAVDTRQPGAGAHHVLVGIVEQRAARCDGMHAFGRHVGRAQGQHAHRRAHHDHQCKGHQNRQQAGAHAGVFQEAVHSCLRRPARISRVRGRGQAGASPRRKNQKVSQSASSPAATSG